MIALASLMAVSCDNGKVDPDPVNPDPPKPPSRYKTYYIAADGDDANAGTAPAFAMRTMAKVLQKIKPGDTIKLMPGTYEYDGKPFLEMKPEHSGTEDEYITIEAQDPNNKPHIIVGGVGVWNAVQIQASYVIIDGLELEGFNQRLDYETAYNYALMSHNHELKDYNPAARYNTNGVSVGDKNSTTVHVTIRNCKIHDFPSSGMGATACDYVTFEYNTIYNNAWYTMYACSGISTSAQVNSDTHNERHKIIFRGNTLYNNKCLIPWASTADFRLSDGNGIICDVNQRPDESGIHKNDGPYLGRILVCNNVSYNNGGSGIHTFKSDHVDIVNNTAYGNGYQYPSKEYAEIYSNQCKDVRIYNNIMYGRPDCPCNFNPGDPSVIYSHNVYFGGVAKYVGEGDKVADPAFVKIATDGTADFHITAGSAAIGNGAALDFVPDIDHDGKPRSGSIDSGAYQFVK